MKRSKKASRERILDDTELRLIWKAAESSTSVFGAIVQMCLLTTRESGRRHNQRRHTDLASPSRFRPAREGPRRFRASRRSILGSAVEKPQRRTRRGKSRDPKNRAEHPTRSSNYAWPQHALSGRLQQTAEMSRRNSAAPSPTGGRSGSRYAVT